MYASPVFPSFDVSPCDGAHFTQAGVDCFVVIWRGSLLSLEATDSVYSGVAASISVAGYAVSGVATVEGAVT